MPAEKMKRVQKQKRTKENPASSFVRELIRAEPRFVAQPLFARVEVEDWAESTPLASPSPSYGSGGEGFVYSGGSTRMAGSVVSDLASGIWGIVSSSGGLVILKLTEEAADAADKIVDAIRNARTGNLVPLEIDCPDGKTRFKVSVREDLDTEKAEEFISICPKKSRAASQSKSRLA